MNTFYDVVKTVYLPRGLGYTPGRTIAVTVTLPPLPPPRSALGGHSATKPNSLNRTSSVPVPESLSQGPPQTAFVAGGVRSPWRGSPPHPSPSPGDSIRNTPPITQTTRSWRQVRPQRQSRNSALTAFIMDELEQRPAPEQQRRRRQTPPAQRASVEGRGGRDTQETQEAMCTPLTLL